MDPDNYWIALLHDHNPIWVNINLPTDRCADGPICKHTHVPTDRCAHGPMCPRTNPNPNLTLTLIGSGAHQYVDISVFEHICPWAHQANPSEIKPSTPPPPKKNNKKKKEESKEKTGGSSYNYSDNERKRKRKVRFCSKEAGNLVCQQIRSAKLTAQIGAALSRCP